jgi:zona occludens toxin (predicted ATPase)
MIVCYTGTPGGGKSLSSISDFLLPQLLKRRHVFCNIIGLNPILIGARLDRPNGGTANRFSTLDVNRYLHRFAMAFDDERAQKERSFFVLRPDGSRYYSNEQGLFRLVNDLLAYPDAMLVLDECHEYLAPENWKLLRFFAKYVSMARHEGHDLILITQSVTDIWEPLRNRIHETHVFNRGRLGFRSQYKDTVYSGWNVYGEPLSSRQRMDDKSIYPLYKSRSDGTEEHLDYTSIWSNKKLLLMLFIGISFIVFPAVWLVSQGGLFGWAQKDKAPSSESLQPAPEYSQSSNVIFVKYVVCGAYDCKATRPDGSVVTLPLDYNSGKYPVEVRKYVPNNNSYLGSFPGFSGGRPGVPNAAR